MIVPSFLKQGVQGSRHRAVHELPAKASYVVTTFTSQPTEGDVSRRTAFVRYNGARSAKQPSFTIISNHCAHLGCPVQPNGPPVGKPSTQLPRTSR